NLGATAGTDVVLSGDVSVDTLDLTATAGEINQQGGSVASTGTTNLGAATDITLGGANNDFSTVNADGAGITLTDTNSLTLGNVSASGNLGATAGTDVVLSGDVSVDTLDLTATAGEINQQGGSVASTGITNLAAAKDIRLGGASNDFSAQVNATGADIELAAVNGVTLGDVTASGSLGATPVPDSVSDRNAGKTKDAASLPNANVGASTNTDLLTAGGASTKVLNLTARILNTRSDSTPETLSSIVASDSSEVERESLMFIYVGEWVGALSVLNVISGELLTSSQEDEEDANILRLY
ncbi:MAG TPA: hypothetical protein VIC30_05915, partial [Orrella sp.]